MTPDSACAFLFFFCKSTFSQEKPVMSITVQFDFFPSYSETNSGSVTNNVNLAIIVRDSVILLGQVSFS